MGDAVVQTGFKKIAYIPLVSGENLMGVMSMAARASGPFDESSLLLLLLVPTWAGLAIANARLYANAHRLAVWEELLRIRMDLHNGLIQSIYGINPSFELAGNLFNEDCRQQKRGFNGMSPPKRCDSGYSRSYS